MITGILLVCLLGVNDGCRADVSKTFFDTIVECERNNKQLADQINKDDKREFFVKGIACVDWGKPK